MSPAVLNSSRHRPGIRFEVQQPAIPDVLPSMDIPLFVGFASSGPLHIPVRVESEQAFESIFGPDVRLAWDPERGDWLYGLLGATVRAFFKNGGRRCWVLRTTSEGATANRFLLPNVLTIGVEANDQGDGDAHEADWPVSQASVQARSEGSWSDRLEVRTDLLVKPFRLDNVVPDDTGRSIVASVSVQGQERGRRGDLVRVRFSDTKETLYFSISDVLAEENPSSPSASSGLTLRIKGSTPTWVSPLKAGGALVSGAVAGAWTNRGSESGQFTGEAPFVNECSIKFEAGGPKITLRFDVEDHPVIVAGDVVRVRSMDGSRECWVSVDDVREAIQEGMENRTVLEVKGRAFTVSKDLEGGWPSQLETADLLTFDLVVRENKDRLWRMADLGFVSGHPRWWGALETDAKRFEPELDRAIQRLNEVEESAGEGQRSAARAGVFPLGSDTPTIGFSFPLEMTGLRSFAPAIRQTAQPLERDGLDVWARELFVDEELAHLRVATILARAEAIQYLQTVPRRLRGIHAALALEEVTILAAPDAVHSGWTFKEKEECSHIGHETLPPREESYWCSEQIQLESVTADLCGKSDFEPCRILEAPEWIDASGTNAVLHLLWKSHEDGLFLLQVAGEPSFSEPDVVYRGTENSIHLQGWNLAETYFRVRIADEGGFSAWSPILKVTAPGEPRWEVDRSDGGVSQDLVQIHRVMLRMCAARGDMFAVLSMPERYREEQAIAHANELRTLISRNATASHLGGVVPALTEEEANCLSFGALYFPWCFTETDRNNRSFLVVPPDGPVSGTMASRALARGAWIAPANHVWRGVVGVANRPRHDVEAEEMLADARVNVVKHEPVGVLVLSQDTLSWDPDLREINVRRLLTLLRRLAHRVGVRYVFEPNNDAFRRTVQRNFQAVMESLYEKGAFRGKTPSESFRVNTGEPVNPPLSVEAGRFFIELKVAPSLPMKFLTVKLVQIGERGFVIEGK
jgi:hypothetical protein